VPFKDGRFIIVFEVSAGNQAPYTFDGRAYERNQTTTVRMPQQRYDQLVSHRFQLNFSWEKIETENYAFDDLDSNLILNVIRKSVEVKRLPEDALRQEIPNLLEALKLLVNGHLINAAVVLFGKKIMPDYPQCQLKLARFKGVDRNEFLDSNIIYGNAFELLEEGMLFIKRHLPVAARIEAGKVERVETPIIPFDAIREALINSLCHREYSNRSGSIGLAIYDNRMELFNDGGLLPGVTIDKIKSGFSNPPNPLIADVFYRCNLIEKWGRGVPKIIKSCKAADDPEPEFLADRVEFKVVFTFPATIKPPVVLVGELAESLTSRQNEIIQILSKVNELNPKDIISLLKEKTTQRTLRRDLTKLKELNILGTHGQGPAAVWYLVSQKK
jgi:ATP-dependent DNA helicase RecG